MDSLASSVITSGDSPTSSTYDIRSRSDKKKKKSSKGDATLDMSTQVLPYVNSALEIATGQLGMGTSLRKASFSSFPCYPGLRWWHKGRVLAYGR